MAREIVSKPLKQQIIEQYNGRCYTCGFSIKNVLLVHHRIPVNLGGKDDIENFVVLCPNCHLLVHRLSSARHNSQKIYTLLVSEYNQSAIERICELSLTIKKEKARIKQEGNIWSAGSQTTHGPYLLEEALASVSRKNSYSDEKSDVLKKVFRLIVETIPQEMKEMCSYRLLSRGRYISINLMNYLLFRTPAYTDFGDNPKYDCYLIFTKSLKDYFEYYDDKNVFTFSNFDCVNLGLYFDEVLNLSDVVWQDFRAACWMAAEAKKTRSWVSNIKIS